MKYVYFVNRFSLKEKSDKLIRALKQLSDQFFREYEIIDSNTYEEYQEALKRFETGGFILTAIGGDGSINLLLNDIVQTDNVLSFIPYGTGNDFNRSCYECKMEGIRDVDLIKINDRYFINVCCFGIDADIANDDRFIHNRFIPRSMRYNAGVIHYFLNYQARKMKIEINGLVVEKPFTTIVAANARYYGNGYRVSPYSLIDDGKMEIILADELPKIKMAKVILSMKDGSHLKNPAIRVFDTGNCIISAEKPFKANIDGEAIEARRFELSILKGRYKIAYDPAFLDALAKML